MFRGNAGNWQVFAVRNGRAELQDVEIGLMNDEHVEIARGLDTDTPVVLAPETDLRDGAKVSVIESAAVSNGVDADSND